MKNTKQPIYDRSNLIDFKDIFKKDKMSESKLESAILKGALLAVVLVVLSTLSVIWIVAYDQHKREAYIAVNHSELKWEELK